MAEDVLTLFEEYAASFRGGEEPDVRAYLARAGDGAGQLARLIDGFLARAEPPPPSEERVLMLRAWLEGRAPLLELRVERGLTRDTVVSELIERLGLDPAKRGKLAGYLHRLETGLLDPRPVDRRVFTALAAALRARVEDLLAWQPRAATVRSVHYRVAPEAGEPDLPRLFAPPSEPDEIDRLFLGG
ncbi:MAG: hypothetical protein IT201_11755 [Thermoleophilia bacterium]|nr:hypothetical protein [Thermoleophilia bacterium]